MELAGIIIIFIISPLETFIRIGDAGTISKFLGSLVLFIFALRCMKNDRISIPKEAYTLMAFILIGLASTLWAAYPRTSIVRSITLVQLFILYIITFNILKNNNGKLAKNMYNIFIISGMIVSIYSIVQAIKLANIDQWTRISISKEIDVNHLSSYLLTPFLLALHNSNTKSIKYLIPTGIILSAIIVTQSRGAFIAILISVGLYFMINIRKQGIRLRNVLVIVISIVLVVFVIPDEFLFRVKEMFTNKDVLLRGSGRSIIWGWAFQEFKSSPLIGIGLGNFTSLYRPPHSSFFQILSELGLLGLALAGVFVCTILFNSTKRLEDRSNIEYIIVIALLLMSLTVDIFYQKYLWIMLGISSSTRYDRKFDLLNKKFKDNICNNNSALLYKTMFK